ARPAPSGSPAPPRRLPQPCATAPAGPAAAPVPPPPPHRRPSSPPTTPPPPPPPPPPPAPPRRPRRCPRASSAAIERAVLAAHDLHPWGARKRHAFLCRAGGVVPVPCRSPVPPLPAGGGAGLPRRSRTPPQRFERGVPNHLWQMDYKGPRSRCPRPRYL